MSIFHEKRLETGAETKSKYKNFAQSSVFCALFRLKFYRLKFFTLLCSLKLLKINIYSFNLGIMEDIASRVKAIIVDKLTVDENEVTPTAEFSKDLGADSLDTVELIMEFEKKFDITIPDEDAEKITTVGDAIEYIEQHTK